MDTCSDIAYGPLDNGPLATARYGPLDNGPLDNGPLDNGLRSGSIGGGRSSESAMLGPERLPSVSATLGGATSSGPGGAKPYADCAGPSTTCGASACRTELDSPHRAAAGAGGFLNKDAIPKPDARTPATSRIRTIGGIAFRLPEQKCREKSSAPMPPKPPRPCALHSHFSAVQFAGQSLHRNFAPENKRSSPYVPVAKSSPTTTPALPPSRMIQAFNSTPTSKFSIHLGDALPRFPAAESAAVCGRVAVATLPAACGGPASHSTIGVATNHVL